MAAVDTQGMDAWNANAHGMVKDAMRLMSDVPKMHPVTPTVPGEGEDMPITTFSRTVALTTSESGRSLVDHLEFAIEMSTSGSKRNGTGGKGEEQRKSRGQRE